MFWEQASNIATAVGLIFTALGLFLNWWENRRNHRLTFFAEYTKRYQEIMIALPFEAFKKDFDVTKLNEVSQKKILAQMLAYFSLCSEEYDLKNEGFVKDRIWNNWAEGITANLQKPAFQWGWEQVKNEFIFFPDFLEWVEKQAHNEA
ncbi:MAG TPA: hypothetical protein PK228_07240 [Saprospiraceae bacterium]|nr:hypothetical protein [Saprospiraceae bacterium]